jgi:hypothetical protein
VHVESSQQVQNRLRAALYRFDCPTPHAIGEYTLDLLIEPNRRLLAQHVLDCQECADELQLLRVFLASDPSPPAPAVQDRWRRVLATLLLPARGVAASPIRGSQRSSGFEYRAGPIRVVLGAVPAHRRGTLALDGLVLHDTATPEAVAGRDVTLFADGVRVYWTVTDDLGNFAFEMVAAGVYRLDIHFADEIVVIDNVEL